MKFTTSLLLAFSAALTAALPNPAADPTPEFSSDLQRRGDYQIAVRYHMKMLHSQDSTDLNLQGCRKDTNACVFTNVKIVCDPATPVRLPSIRYGTENTHRNFETNLKFE